MGWSGEDDDLIMEISTGKEKKEKGMGWEAIADAGVFLADEQGERTKEREERKRDGKGAAN